MTMAILISHMGPIPTTRTSTTKSTTTTTANTINTKITSNNLSMLRTDTTMKRKSLVRSFEYWCLTNLSGYYNADANNPYQQDGGYYEGNQQGYQDEYAEQYHDQNPAAGQHGGYVQNGNGYVA